MKISKILFLVIALTLMCGCEAKKEETPEQPQNEVSNKQSKFDKTYEEFVSQFPKEYPDFEIIDIQKGTSENDPILLVAVGENKDGGEVIIKDDGKGQLVSPSDARGSSQTLFIVDDDGVGELTLASTLKGMYRKEDGLVLDKNVILVSLDCIESDNTKKIHDFKITVTKKYDQETPHTIYKNDETIRKE